MFNTPVSNNQHLSIRVKRKGNGGTNPMFCKLMVLINLVFKLSIGLTPQQRNIING